MNDLDDLPVTPHEVSVIARRVAEGFDGEVLPLEANAGVVMVCDRYDGDLDGASEAVYKGAQELARLAREEIPL